MPKLGDLFSEEFGVQMDQERKRAAVMGRRWSCQRVWVQAEEREVFVRVTEKSEWSSFENG